MYITFYTIVTNDNEPPAAAQAHIEVATHINPLNWPSVIAGTYFSLTQSAPLSFMMHKAKQALQHKQVDGNEQFHLYYFCDVSADGNCIDCATTTLIDWLDQTSRNMTWGALNVKM